MCSAIKYANTVTGQVNICNDQVKPIALSSGLGAVVSACVAGVFGVMNPVGGLIFGATAAAANAIASTILSSWSGHNEARANLSGYLMIPMLFVNAAAAAALTAMLGFPLTWMGVAACASAVLVSQMFAVRAAF